MSDVILIGGGVIGLSIAWELSGQGVSVTVLEKGDFGKEASWAGAGMLPPGNLNFARTPEARLRALSHSLWDQYTTELRELTGIDNGYHRRGTLHVHFSDSDSLQSEIAQWQTEQVQLEKLSGTALCDYEPALHPELTIGYRLAEQGQIRNPRHLKALIAGCTARGVILKSGVCVHDFETNGQKILAVRTSEGNLSAGQYCVTGGAWSTELLHRVGCETRIAPVRGQMLLLQANGLPFRQIIEQGSRYLVPRPDGRILAGSTEENVGFFKTNTPAAISDLIQFATRLVPELGQTTFERAWSGLRPGTADGLPYLGAVPGFDNLAVAAGHFRSGLQMSPGSARVIRQFLLGQELSIPLEDYSPTRHGSVMNSP